jgi:ADP-ribose pyrophosphatase YjhB (NUDIX family)
MNLLNKDGISEEQYLQGYDASRFERPSVTVDILLFSVDDEEPENYRKLPEKVLKILLIKRGEHPFLDQWALPGGFVGMKESLDEAVRRELESETNVADVYLEQLYTWGAPNRDPRTRVISCSYMALVDSKSLKIKAGDDAADARWFTVKRKIIEQQKVMTDKGYVFQEKVLLQLCSDKTSLCSTLKMVKTVEGKQSPIRREVLESERIAFDHANILDYGIDRLRNKLEYTDIVFNLMPEYFTLTGLQQVYEAILDKELLKANFRRKTTKFVLETNRMTKDDGHRPAKLYRFNSKWNEEYD